MCFSERLIKLQTVCMHENCVLVLPVNIFTVRWAGLLGHITHYHVFWYSIAFHIWNLHALQIQQQGLKLRRWLISVPLLRIIISVVRHILTMHNQKSKLRYLTCNRAIMINIAITNHFLCLCMLALLGDYFIAVL